MDRRARDKSVMKKILKYCEQVAGTHEFFHEDEAQFFDEESGFASRNAIAMPVFQIGELTNALSDELRASRPDIPWRDIVGMRNIVAHHYGKIEIDTLWSVSRDDVPALAEQIREILEAEDHGGAE